MKKPIKAAVILALIALGFMWRPAWGLLIVFLLVEWAEDRWKELLDAIRGRRRGSSESKQEQDELQEEFEQQREYERQIEAAHQKSQFKHVPGLPWGDPSSYVKALTPEELEQTREDFQKREADRYAGLAKQDAERKRQQQEAEKREQEAREHLKREAERAINEREEQREAKKREPDGKPPGYVH